LADLLIDDGVDDVPRDVSAALLRQQILVGQVEERLLEIGRASERTTHTTENEEDDDQSAAQIG
jgi:hypothetical protein